jgi:hypothetical protein
MKKLLTLAFLLSAMALDLHSQQPPSVPDSPPADRALVPDKKLPAGTVTEADVTRLADGGLTGQVLYLVGTFIVTARDEHRVVLRFDGKPRGARIIADYPPAIPTPAEGAKVVCEETGAFLITDIRRGRDGQIVVFVRDVTTP